MPITRLLLVLEVWDGKPTYRKSWAGNLLMWSDLTLGPSFNFTGDCNVQNICYWSLVGKFCYKYLVLCLFSLKSASDIYVV